MTLSMSIIIPTFNSGPFLRGCLESIRAQDYPTDRIEVIVVDNNSNDGTAEICSKFNVKLIQRAAGRSEARNLGGEEASSDLILFLDSDMTLSPSVTREAIERMSKDPEMVGLNIPERISGSSYFSKVRDFERSFYNNTVIDGVRVMRRRAFLEVGGFDVDLYAGEDWDLHKRLLKMGPIGSIESPLHHHEETMSIQKYLQKKSFYSSNLIDKYIEKWRGDPDVKKQLSPMYRFIIVFVEDGKWKRDLRHPLLAMSVLGLRAMVGLTFLASLKGRPSGD